MYLCFPAVFLLEEIFTRRSSLSGLRVEPQGEEVKLLGTLEMKAGWEKVCALIPVRFFCSWVLHCLAKPEPEELCAILSQLPGSTEGVLLLIKLVCEAPLWGKSGLAMSITGHTGNQMEVAARPEKIWSSIKNWSKNININGDPLFWENRIWVTIVSGFSSG